MKKKSNCANTERTKINGDTSKTILHANIKALNINEKGKAKYPKSPMRLNVSAISNSARTEGIEQLIKYRHQIGN